MTTALEAPADLSGLRPIRGECKKDDGFWVYQKVCVFKEHTREVPIDKNDPFSDLIKVTFNEDDMENIAEHNNFRVQNSRDFAAVVIGHNPSPEERKAGIKRPSVVGLMGPYWTDWFGELEPKRAVFCEMRVYERDKEEADRHPRRSVEYWPKNPDPRHPDFKVGDLDPLALLGSETPELDVGILYDRTRAGRTSLNYQMDSNVTPTAPCGNNTFVPGMTDKRKEDYAADPDKKAIDPVDVKDSSELAAGSEPADEPAVAAKEPTNDLDVGPEPDAGGAGDSTADSMPTAEEGQLRKLIEAMSEVMPELIQGMIDDATKSLTDRVAVLEQSKGINPLTGEGAADATDAVGVPAPAAPMPAAEPAIPPTLPAGGADMSAPAEPTNATNVADDPSKEPAKYSRQGAEPVQMSKENQGKYAFRYQRLEELSASGILIDAGDEIKDLANVTDEQFERQVSRISTHYQRGKVSLPGVRSATKHALQYSRLEQGQRNEIAIEAKKKYAELTKTGRSIDYWKDVLAPLCNEKGIEYDINAMQ